MLVAGGDDQVWPSIDYASAIEQGKFDHGHTTAVVSSQAAGHRVILPGDQSIEGGHALARGGTELVDRDLGQRAWQEIRLLIERLA